jgi:hypothetical protein
VDKGCYSFKYYGRFLCKGFPFGSNPNPDGAFASSLATEQEHDENKSPGQPDIDEDETKHKKTAFIRKSSKLLEVTDTAHLLTAGIGGTQSLSTVMMHTDNSFSVVLKTPEIKKNMGEKLLITECKDC